MPTNDRIRWLPWIVAATVIASATAIPVALANKTNKFFVKYATKSDCVVYPNFPKPGVKGQKLSWTVPADDNLVWRYNANDTWAVVQDPTRAKHHFPWWGFTKRSCLGRSVKQSDYPTGISVPKKIRKGRSRVEAYCPFGWRPVGFTQGPEAVVQHGVKVKHDATLRDDANFFVGNVFQGWKVDVTNLTRANGHWVYVYSPSARKWGYIEDRKLDR